MYVWCIFNEYLMLIFSFYIFHRHVCDKGTKYYFNKAFSAVTKQTDIVCTTFGVCSNVFQHMPPHQYCHCQLKSLGYFLL